MRFTKMRRLLALSAGGLCFPAQAFADTPATHSKTQTTAPGTAATSFIIDRSPMSTSAEDQSAANSETVNGVNGYADGEMETFLLLTRAGMAGRQGNQPTDDPATALRKKIKRFQDAFAAPDSVPNKFTKRAAVVKFFQYVHDNDFDIGDLDKLLAKLQEDLGAEKPDVAAINLRYNTIRDYLLEQYAEDTYPRRYEIFAFEEQSRWLDKADYHTARLTYSNFASGLDFTGQYLTGTTNGFGAGLRLSLDRYHNPPSASAPPDSPSLPAADLTLPTSRIVNLSIMSDVYKKADLDAATKKDFNTIIATSNAAVPDALSRLAHYILRPHFGLAANYQHLHGVGDAYDAGLNASALLPSRLGNRPNAYFFSASLRYQWFEAEGSANNAFLAPGAAGGGNSGSRKGVGGSFVLAFQDNAPHFDDDGKAHLGRWHLRAGVEYAPQNALTSHDYAALFLRLRDRGPDEYTFLLGSEVNGQAFVGINFSCYFGGPKRQKPFAASPAGKSLAE